MINNNNMFFIGKSNKIMFLKFNNTSIIITRIRYSIFIIANINNLTANRVTWISHWKHIACSPSDVSKSLNFASIMTSLA